MDWNRRYGLPVNVTRQQYNEAYISHMAKIYEEDVKNEQCPR